MIAYFQNLVNMQYLLLTYSVHNDILKWNLSRVVRQDKPQRKDPGTVQPQCQNASGLHR